MLGSGGVLVSDYEVALRLCIALIFGGIIGYERQAHHKSAGLRTHILVCLGSCLIMSLSINLYKSVQGLTNADPARLAAQVVSGIGFLGAGAIIKEGVNIRGLTTAASLWVVSGVGLAVGGGYYFSATLVTLLSFLVLTILAYMERKNRKGNVLGLEVSCLNHVKQVAEITACLAQEAVSIREIHMESDKSVLTLQLLLELQGVVEADMIIAKISSVSGVHSVHREA